MKDHRPYKILVIEDNPGDFTIVEEFLTEQILVPGIVQVNNFKQASAILLAGDSVFDVILLDLTLPDKSGQQLITEMLEIASLSPIIILTGYADRDFSIHSISQGILDYLLKDDLNATTLYKSILYSIERKKIISELKSSKQRYSDLFYLSPQPMWVIDMETLRFTQVNKAAINHYGYSEVEFLAMTIMGLRPGGDLEKMKDLICKEKPEEDGTYKGTVLHYKKSGEQMEVEIYSTPLLINNKSYRSAIGIDVTEKNLYEHKITKAIIKTQEDERYEIGSELHDNVCQILATSQLNLGMLKDSIPSSKIMWFNQCKEYITLASREIRNLSHRLAPTFFDDTTLEEAFKRLFTTFHIDKEYKILLHFDDAAKEYPLPLEIQLNLYRILQEQLRNILKHAHAGFIEVVVLIHDHQLEMSISDDGVGFNTDILKAGIGLANIKRRAELFSGMFEIESSPGHGCKIVIRIPLKEVY
jgi:PAS domain S-box-containing protein